MARAAKAKPEVAEQPAPVEVVAYKAFDAGLACRGYQYAIGETFTMDGTPRICDRGFHACENPFDVFNYYPLGSRVARVTLRGAVDRQKGENEDSKICGVSISVDAELRMPEVVKAAVAWIMKAAKGNTATGDRGHAAVAGHASIAASLGIEGTARAEIGGAISLGCFVYNNGTNRYDLVAVRSSLVGQNGVEAGKTYHLNAAGDFVVQS